MRIRTTSEADRESYVTTLLSAFGTIADSPATDPGQWWSAFELERGLVAESDGEIIGTAGAYTFELTLPGDTVVPVAGVTAVGVLPSHRRRGVLTTLMRHQLDQLRDAGECMAVLLASEAVIYRRFGYGPATFMQSVSVPRHRATFADPARDTTISVHRRAECGDLLADIYERYRHTQPGALSRPPIWWDLGAGRPPVSRTSRLIALHHDQKGQPDGYASYLVGPVDPATRARVLTVDELIATDRNSYADLFRFCLEHDLVTDTAFQTLPPQSWLRWLLVDYRAAVVTKEHDWLWVRLLDIPRALAARRYLTDGRIVLDVADQCLQGIAGRYALTVSGGIAKCERTDEAADLSLDISDLGSLYLGGTSASLLADAGRLRVHAPVAARLADALFQAEAMPHTVHWF